MNKLGNIVISGLLGFGLLSCARQFKNEEKLVNLSNGLHAYGAVTTQKVNNREFRRVHVREGITINDYGNGDVVAVMDGESRERRGDALTYEYCCQKFPIWEPTAFRETECYASMGRYSPCDTTSKD